MEGCRRSSVSVMLGCCWLLLAQQPVAQDFIDEGVEFLYGDEEVVSIATGSSKPQRLAPSVTSVITAEDIRVLGANSLEDVLRTVTGVHVSVLDRYGSHISMRGIYTEAAPETLVLLNGTPLSEVYSGARIIMRKFPIRNINRIEIIRGPGSAVYGADAFAGVINIITYGNDDLGALEVGVSAGSYDTYGGWLKAKTEMGDWALSVQLETEQSKGDEGRTVERDTQTVLDEIFLTSVSHAPGSADTHYEYINTQIQLSRPHWEFTLNTYYQDEAGLGTGIADALDPTGNQYYLQHLLDANYSTEDRFDDWRTDVSVNYHYLKQKNHYTIFPAGAVLPIDSNGNFNPVAPAGVVFFPDGLLARPGGQDDYYSIDLVEHFTGFENHDIRFAAGYKHQKTAINERLNFGPGVIDGSQPVVDGSLTDITGTSFIFLEDTDRHAYHVSLQDEWVMASDWVLTAGLRYDDYSDFGSTTNPRLALVWETTYKLTSKLLYGRAFRAPALSELFAKNNPVFLGNEDLDPETIDTIELVFNYRYSYALNTQFSIYRYDIDGLINFVPDPMNVGEKVAQNSHDQDGHGVEMEASWALNDALTLSGNFAWQDTENSQLKEPVAEAPKQLISMRVDWQLYDQWQLTGSLRHVADRERASFDSRDDLDDYTLVNINLFKERVFGHWDMGLVIHNAFDEEALEPGDPSIPIDHPLQGRSIIFSLDYRLD
ncbi:TonB-dependent receptor [Aurantivibrio plasticivorans]